MRAEHETIFEKGVAPHFELLYLQSPWMTEANNEE
jgi:hypothetical protein